MSSSESQDPGAAVPAQESVLTDLEFAQIMEGPKVISGDITWEWRDQALSAYAFRADIYIGEISPIFVNGHFKLPARSLSYSIIHRTEGRIYSLDMGHPHGDLHDKARQGPLHKHIWSEEDGNAKNVYVPSDITASVAEPAKAWSEFCAEANINHDGAMLMPASETQAEPAKEKQQ